MLNRLREWWCQGARAQALRDQERAIEAAQFAARGERIAELERQTLGLLTNIENLRKRVIDWQDFSHKQLNEFLAQVKACQPQIKETSDG